MTRPLEKMSWNSESCVLESFTCMRTKIITRIVWESTKEKVPGKYSRMMSDKEQKGQLVCYNLEKNLTILDVLGRRERKKAAMKSMESVLQAGRYERGGEKT